MAWVLFFDGECAFCSNSVRQVVRLDRSGQVFFAPLQGKLASDMGFQPYAAKTNGSMVLLRECDGRIFMHSDGLIELARVLGGWWRIFTLARFIPKRLRDAVYRWIARNRYRIMGRMEHCSLPDPVLVKRLRQ